MVGPVGVPRPVGGQARPQRPPKSEEGNKRGSTSRPGTEAAGAVPKFTRRITWTRSHGRSEATETSRRYMEDLLDYKVVET